MRHRIKEVEERTGITAGALRQWERRYGFPEPHRTEGGHRLYSDETVEAIRRVSELVEEGVLTSEAIRRVKEDLSRRRVEGNLDTLTERLVEAVLRPDLAEAHHVLSMAHAQHPTEVVLLDMIAPCLSAIGDTWEEGGTTVAQEHVASAFLRTRMGAMFDLLGPPRGPPTIVANLPGDRHDLGSLLVAILLRHSGIDVLFTGGDTPLEDLADLVELVDAPAVVLSTATAEPLMSIEAGQLAGLAPFVALGGRGVRLAPEEAALLGADHVGTDPLALRDLAAAGWRT